MFKAINQLLQEKTEGRQIQGSATLIFLSQTVDAIFNDRSNIGNKAL